MKFKEYNEAFDKPYKLKLNRDSDSIKEYQFVTDQDKKYYIHFRYQEGEFGESWELSFSTQYGDAFINKSGNAFRVFATVLAAMKRHKRDLDEGVEFAADTKESSRVKLYDVMAKQIKKEFEFTNLNTKKIGQFKYYKLDNQ